MVAGDVVRLVNTGDTPFTDAYNGRAYTIPAHSEQFVEWDAMCLWLGHPEATNFDPRNRVRVAEFSRLKVRYGVDARALEESTRGNGVDSDALFNSMRPPLEAYDSGGHPIVTVADDPDGSFLAPPDDQSQSSQQLIAARMAQMEQEMVNLRSQLATQNRQNQALQDAEPIGIDTPSQVPPASAPSIPNTVIAEEPDTSQSPRPTPRTTPGEDSPTRVRVSGG